MHVAKIRRLRLAVQQPLLSYLPFTKMRLESADNNDRTCAIHRSRWACNKEFEGENLVRERAGFGRETVGRGSAMVSQPTAMVRQRAGRSHGCGRVGSGSSPKPARCLSSEKTHGFCIGKRFTKSHFYRNSDEKFRGLWGDSQTIGSPNASCSRR